MSDFFGRGVRLGIDVGTVRVGVARSDPDGILATPVATLQRDLGGRRGTAGRRNGNGAAKPSVDVDVAQVTAPDGVAVGGRAAVPSDQAEIAKLVVEYEVVEVIVGLPVMLTGREGQAAAQVRDYATSLASLIDPVPVRLSDERMSTVVAARRLSERGVRGRRQRTVVDQAAAVEILQSWLEAWRARMTHGGERAD